MPLYHPPSLTWIHCGGLNTKNANNGHIELKMEEILTVSTEKYSPVCRLHLRGWASTCDGVCPRGKRGRSLVHQGRGRVEIPRNRQRTVPVPTRARTLTCQTKRHPSEHQTREHMVERRDTAMDIWSLGVVTMQMLQIGSLSKPEDGVAHGATWCESIEKRAVETSLLSAKIQQRSSGPLLPALVTELWSFLANFMLKVDPKKRASAKDCHEAGRLTVFKSFNTTDGVATVKAPQTSQLKNTITGGPSVAGASSQHADHLPSTPSPAASSSPIPNPLSKNPSPQSILTTTTIDATNGPSLFSNITGPRSPSLFVVFPPQSALFQDTNPLPGLSTRKPSMSDPAVEDSTDESTTALPNAATLPANDSQGQIRKIAHLDRMKTRYGRVLMDWMRS